MVEKLTFSATNLHDELDMKTRFGCIILPCGCLVPFAIFVLALLATGSVVLAKSLL